MVVVSSHCIYTSYLSCPLSHSNCSPHPAHALTPRLCTYTEHTTVWGWMQSWMDRQCTYSPQQWCKLHCCPSEFGLKWYWQTWSWSVSLNDHQSPVSSEITASNLMYCLGQHNKLCSTKVCNALQEHYLGQSLIPLQCFSGSTPNSLLASMNATD